MRVYVYGARPPVENARLIEEQFRLAHSYQCALVAIERRRRGVVDRLYRLATPAEWTEFEAADQACAKAAEAVSRSRSTNGDMLEPDDEMAREREEIHEAAKAELATARERQKAARQAWYDAKKAATPKLKKRLKMCDRGAYALGKRAYNLAGTVGLAWGTRLKVAESAERAAKAAIKEGTLPHFPKFDGGGIVTVQLQGESGVKGKNGLSAKDALAGSDTRFRLECVPSGAWQMMQGSSAFTANNRHRVCAGKGCVDCGGTGRIEVALEQPKPGGCKDRKRLAAGGFAIVRLRIASNGRTPVWGVWPVMLSRALPENAPIKWAQMHARKVGPRTEWRLIVTVDDEVMPLRTEGLTLAVNLGWRNLPDGGLRVGYAVGSDGYKEEVRVPPAYVSGVTHVDSLRAIRDQRLETLKKDLTEWAGEGERPDWFEQAVRYADQWRSPKRIAFLLRDWRTRRFDGDERVFKAVTDWNKQDRHLWFWECDEREKLLRMRKDFYRTVAAHWASKYARILVTDMDLRDFAELPAPEDAAKSKDATQRRSRFMAAPSELRGAVENACSSRGAAFEEVEAKYATQTCHACGIVFMFAARQDLEHTCADCEVRWDQDENHCRNLLARDEVTRKSARPLAPSVVENSELTGGKKGRWQERRSRNALQTPESVSKVS